MARSRVTSPHDRPTGPAAPFSDRLEHWLITDEAKTLGSLGEVFAEKSFAVTILLLMSLPALPLPTGGITHLFEAIAVVVAGEMVLGRRTLWLPARWRRRELGPLTTGRSVPFMVRWTRRCERFSRPRGVRFYRSRWSSPVLGLMLMGLATSAALAPPFSGLDTLPALGAVAVAMSIILEDIVLLAIGLVVGSGGALVILTIGSAVLHVVQNLLS